MNLSWDTLTEDVITAVADTLEDELEGVRVQCLDGLSDGPQDTPLMQVHWMTDDWDPHAAEGDRTAFRGALQQASIDLQIWAFIRPRGLIGEDQQATVEWADKLRAVLRGQARGFFGTEGSPRVRGCTYRIEAISWTTGGNRRYAGFRAHLTVRVF